jgi:hypothetical protein
MTQKQQASIDNLPTELLLDIAKNLETDLPSTALAGSVSRRWYRIFATQKRELKCHSRVWGSIFRPTQWNSKMWNEYSQDGPEERGPSYELALIGRDLKYIYNADELEKGLPQGIEPLHLMLVVLRPDGRVGPPSYELQKLARPGIEDYLHKAEGIIKIKLHYYPYGGMDVADLWKITGTTTCALFCKNSLGLQTINVSLNESKTYMGKNSFRNNSRQEGIRYPYEWAPSCEAKLTLTPKQRGLDVKLRGLMPATKPYEPEGKRHMADMIEYVKRADIIEGYERKRKN